MQLYRKCIGVCVNVTLMIDPWLCSAKIFELNFHPEGREIAKTNGNHFLASLISFQKITRNFLSSKPRN